MSHVLSVFRKESRAFFRSPVAIIFLAVYLLFTLLTFFGVEQFFARNIADLRPLFSWLPLLLIFLCSALTMRQWSEEQKMGTLEVLFTLPVRIPQLVLGKFFASLGLVAVALLLTLPIPFMVASQGDLDWGPVLGGYIGALLLAGAYLSIGLFVSSLTDNQIVALIGAVVISGLFWAVGSDTVVQFVGRDTAELLTAIGTGSRFESIRRGVLDIRDLAYYFTLIASFLTLNAVVLEAKGWSDGQRTVMQRSNAKALAFLVVVNSVLFNVLVAKVTSLRIDMTERGEYTISPVTEKMLRGLEEPLLLRGYFSEKTHPLLAPLVPRIRDTLLEYEIIGGDRVEAEFIDPLSGTEERQIEVRKEAEQKYGIKTSTFQTADANQRSITNSYFSILVQYGDQFEVLNYQDLIEVTGTNPQNIEVKLRNLEYDLTSAIKKVAYGFQTLDAVFASMASPAKLTAFISEGSLPEDFQEVPERIRDVAAELVEQGQGKFEFEVVDPTAADAEWTPTRLAETYGFQPFRVSLLSTDTFYLHLLLEMGDRLERVLPAGTLSEADIKQEITAALKRGAPGFLKTVGLAKPEIPDYSQLPPQMRQQMPPPPPDLTRALRQTLSEGYSVDEVDLKDGRVPGDVDVLMVYAPADYDDKQAFAIDQHLMKGGTVIVIGGRYDFDPQSGGAISVKRVRTGLEETFEAYGLRLDDALVMDSQNEPIPVPVERDLGGLRVREVKYLDYPFFVDVRPDGMADASPVTAGLPSVTVPWASPIVVTGAGGDDAEGAAVEYTPLLRSSSRSWTKTDTNVQPDLRTYPERGFPVGSDQEARTLAVMATGRFDSAFAGKAPPEGVTAGVVEQSPSDARLVVVASASFASDVLLQLSQQAESNLQLVQNLVDWGLEDTDLLSIRSRGTFARTLAPLDEEERSYAIAVTSGISILALAVIIVITVLRQRTLRPFPLESRSGHDGAKVSATAEPQGVSS